MGGSHSSEVPLMRKFLLDAIWLLSFLSIDVMFPVIGFNEGLYGGQRGVDEIIFVIMRLFCMLRAVVVGSIELFT